MPDTVLSPLSPVVDTGGVTEPVVVQNPPAADPFIRAFAYDATDPANLVLFNTDRIGTMTDTTGQSANAVQGTDTVRPILTPNAINGLSAAHFGPTALKSMTIQNAVAYTKGANIIGVRGVWKPTAFPAGAAFYNLLKNFSSTANTVNRATWTIDSAGRPRYSGVRMAGDTSVNVLASLTFTLGQQADFDFWVNAVKGLAYFRINNRLEVKPVLTAGVPGWSPSGLGPFENLNASAAPIIGRISGGNEFMGMISVLEGYTGDPEPEIAAFRDEQHARFDTPFPTVAASPPEGAAAWRVWQQNFFGVANVPVGVDVTHGDDAEIEVRLVSMLDGTTVGLDWTSIGMSSNLHAEGVLPAVPAGFWYREQRKVGEADQHAIRDTTYPILVGDVEFWNGQSPGRKWWGGDGIFAPFSSEATNITLPGTGFAVYMGRRWSGWSWADLTGTIESNSKRNGTNEPVIEESPTNFGVGGNATAELSWRYATRRGYPLGIVAYNIGGRPYSYWREDTGPSWIAMAATIERPGGPGYNGRRAINTGGEKDANQRRGYDAVFEDLCAWEAQWRAKSGNPSIKLYVSILGPMATTESNDESVDQVRRAQMDWAKRPNCYIAWSAASRPLGYNDSQHVDRRDPATYFAPWYERNTAFDDGVAGVTHGARGPNIVSVAMAAGSNEFVAEVEHDGGTTLLGFADGSPASTGITGFSRFRLGGELRTVTSAWLDDGKVRGTVDGAAAVDGQSVELWFLYGGLPVTTNVPTDDTALRVHMRPTNGPVVGTVTS